MMLLINDKWSSAWMEREAGGGLGPYDSIQARRRLWQWAGRRIWADWQNRELTADWLQLGMQRGSRWGAGWTSARLPQGLWRAAFLPCKAGKGTCVRACVRVCVLFWLSSPQDWGYDCLESGHVFLKSHPGSGLHHHQPQLSVGFGEVHGAGVTSGAVNALTRGCPRDPPHACVLMFPVLQATAGTALLWRGVLWVTPRLSQQTPSQRAPDWDFCNAQLAPGLWGGFTPDCFRSVLVPTIYLPLDG